MTGLVQQEIEAEEGQWLSEVICELLRGDSHGGILTGDEPEE